MNKQQLEPKVVEITIRHYDYSCGDGCCHYEGMEIGINGETFGTYDEDKALNKGFSEILEIILITIENEFEKKFFDIFEDLTICYHHQSQDWYFEPCYGLIIEDADHKDKVLEIMINCGIEDIEK